MPKYKIWFFKVIEDKNKENTYNKKDFVYYNQKWKHKPACGLYCFWRGFV